MCQNLFNISIQLKVICVFVKVKSTTYTGIVSSISSSTSDIEEIPLLAMPKSFFLLFRESLASTLPDLLILSAPLVFFLYKLFFSILFYSRRKTVQNRLLSTHYSLLNFSLSLFLIFKLPRTAFGLKLIFKKVIF